jgi:peptidoglycan/xylan/chitin deacetylase (PgdA/CDA1 family)
VQRRFINLTFHGIGPCARSLDAGEEKVWVSLERYSSVLDAVVGREDVQITFDDGNVSDLTHALPGLVSRGLVATFFVVAGRVGEPEFLSAADVVALQEAGMTIGSHGMHHRPWRKSDDEGLHEELVESRRVLEDVLGHPVVDAACPFGSYDRRVLRALQRAGYERVYTSDRGSASPGEWLQARTTITEDHALDPILSPAPAKLRRRAELVAKRWR